MDIKNARKRTGLSQIKLAYLAKISRFRLYLAENGYLSLADSEKEKIEKILKEHRK